MTPPRPRRTPDTVGWSIVAAMTAVVAVTWAPYVTRPLAANHLGNVTARYGLQVRNLYEQGLVNSRFGADWNPYRSTAYAHHPPLLNVLDSITGLLPGDGAYQLRIAPFLLALTVVPAGAALLRTLGLSWAPTLLSTGTLVATPMFWVYGPLMFDLGVIAALAAVVVRLRSDGTGTWAIRSAVVLAIVVTFASWPGVAFGWVLVVWLVAGRGRDRTSWSVAAGAAIGTVGTLAYVVGISGPTALLDQTERRTNTGSFTALAFTRKVGGHLDALFPTWYLVVLIPAVIVGIVDRRTRTPTSVAALFAVGWLVVLNQGAFVHDYWGYLLLAPGLLGLGAALDRIVGTVCSRWRAGGPAVVALVSAVVAATFLTSALGATATHYLDEPGAGGRAIAAIEPPVVQTTAWIVGFQYGRILSYAWGLPVGLVSDLEVGDLDPTELVVVDAARLPDWWPSSAPPIPVAQGGNVLIVTAGALSDALADDPTDL